MILVNVIYLDLNLSEMVNHAWLHSHVQDLPLRKACPILPNKSYVVECQISFKLGEFAEFDA
jgi:hypothetical protein